MQNSKAGLIIESLSHGRILEASKKDLVAGNTFVLNSNITLRSIKDSKGNDRDNDIEDSKHKYTDAFIKELEKAANGKVSVSKSKTAIKLTPGCEIELLSVEGKSYLAKLSDDICFYLDPFNDLKKIDLKGSAPKVKKEQGPILYAIYGTPDIYGRAETQWHWTQNEEESDKEFKEVVKHSAKRAAEREYREYDPNSIKTMYFRSEDEFLKKCSKLGIKPKMN